MVKKNTKMPGALAPALTAGGNHDNQSPPVTHQTHTRGTGEKAAHRDKSYQPSVYLLVLMSSKYYL